MDDKVNEIIRVLKEIGFKQEVSATYFSVFEMGYYSVLVKTNGQCIWNLSAKYITFEEFIMQNPHDLFLFNVELFR